MLIIRCNEKHGYTSYIDETGEVMAHGEAYEEDKCEVCHRYFEDLEACWIHEPDDQFTLCLDCGNVVELKELIQNNVPNIERCPKCSRSLSKLVLTPELIHYGKVVCSECGAFIRWAPQPRNTGGVK